MSERGSRYCCLCQDRALHHALEREKDQGLSARAYLQVGERGIQMKRALAHRQGRGNDMKIHIRYDDSNKLHTRFTLFLNGANCGQLCTRTDEACNLHQLISSGCARGIDEFLSTGKVHEGKP